MKKSSVVAVACVALALHSVHSEEFHWVGASNDWWNAASYSASRGGPGGTRMPGAEDRVVLSTGQRVFVDDSTIAFFSTVREVYTSGPDIILHFNVSTNADLGCYLGSFGGTAQTDAWLAKAGIGRLTLAKAGSTDLYKSPTTINAYHYNVNIDLREGELALEPCIGANLRHKYGDVKVAEGCTLYGVEGAITWIESLAGAGNVTNRVTAGSKLQIVGARDEPTVFSGVLSGFSYFMPQGHTWFTGASSTIGTIFRPAGYTGADDVGITGFMTFAGPYTEPSSLGCGSINAQYAARLLYLGTTGETIERSVTMENTVAAPFTWDAGAYGGLVFTGGFAADGTEGRQQRILFTGSNTVTCVLSNRFSRKSTSEGCSFHITKSGTGTWRFCEWTGDSDNQLSGVVGVEEGVLECDTLREAGTDSALGSATELYEDRCENVTNGLAAVSYAHFLGGPSTSGTLRYLGDASRTIRHRPLALKGDGRVEAPNCAVLNWVGVSGLGEGEKTLTVDCAEGQTNRYANITDGDGVVSVMKDGPGELVLSGELSFSGDLVSSGGGCLTVRNTYGLPYEYYRLTLKETVYTSTNELFSEYVPMTGNTSTRTKTRTAILNEFGLYASDGTRVNLWGSAADGDCEATLGKGKIALQSADSFLIHSQTKNDVLYLFRPWRLLDNDCAAGRRFAAMWDDDERILTADDPLSWMSVVLRMKDGSGEVAFFDVNLQVGRGDGSFGQNPTAFAVSASADGLIYEDLYVTNDCITATSPGYSYWWLSDGRSAYDEKESTKPEDVDHAKIALPHSTVQTACNVLGNVRSVSAAAGSVLRYEGPSPAAVSGLKVRDGAIGAIEGFAFDAEGTLYLEEIDPDAVSLDIPAVLGGVTDLANLKGWALSVNGQDSGRYKIASVSADGIRVVKPGLRFVIR